MKKTILLMPLLWGLCTLLVAQTNLLTNPGAESDYEGWIKTDGGNGWSTTLMGEYAPAVPRTGLKNWTSSYGWCTLVQTVDLLSANFTENYLDATPNIEAGVYVATAQHAAAYATIKVELCDANGLVLSTHYVCDYLEIPANTSWTEKKLLIIGYGTGVRKIKFHLMGIDKPGWAGYWGPQFDDAFLKLTQSDPTFANAATSQGIKVYPNPSTDFISLGDAKGWIRIYDTKGAIVLSLEAKAHERINISSLEKGIYILKNENQMIKLIKN